MGGQLNGDPSAQLSDPSVNNLVGSTLPLSSSGNKLDPSDTSDASKSSSGLLNDPKGICTQKVGILIQLNLFSHYYFQ